MTAFIINFTLFLIFIIYLSSIKKRARLLKNKIDEDFKTLDVYLKRRWDLTFSIVKLSNIHLEKETVLIQKFNKYKKYDYDTLEDEDKIKFYKKLSIGLNKLFDALKNSDTIKEDEELKKVLKEFNSNEDEVEKTKKHHNYVIKDYNSYVEKFPVCFFCSLFGFDKKETLEDKKDETEE